MTRDNESGLRILAFFGSDLGSSPIECLRRASSGGCRLLALDAAAVGAAVDSNLPFTVIDEWVAPEKLQQLKAAAAQCETAWFEGAREAFTWNGTCWPERDRRAMTCFWREAVLACELARVFTAAGAVEVRFFESTPPRPGIYYGRSEVWSELLKGLLGSRAVALRIENVVRRGGLWHSVRAGLTRAKHGLYAQATAPMVRARARKQLAALKGKTVLAFNIAEFHRFSTVAGELRQHRPGKTGAVTFFGSAAQSDQISAHWNMPVLYSPRPNRLSPDLQKKFLAAYEKLRAVTPDDALWAPAIRHLGFHFRFYCTQRWPMLAEWLEWWRGTWEEVRPEAVIVSSLDDTESRLASIAAEQMGIVTTCVPHAGVAIADSLIPTRFAFYEFPVQKKFLTAMGVKNTHLLIPCRGLLAKSEYTVTSHESPRHEGVWRILVLTDPCALRGAIMPSPVSFGLQIEAIRILASPPADIAAKVSLHFKVHPGFPELELFRAAGREVTDKLLPQKSSLQSALDAADLVIGLNYSGSAILHVLMGNKTMVFFSNRPPGVTSIAADSFASAGTTVHGKEDLWRTVREFFTVPERAAEMTAICRRFADEELAPKDCPDIGTAIDIMLEKAKEPEWRLRVDVSPPDE